MALSLEAVTAAVVTSRRICKIGAVVERATVVVATVNTISLATVAAFAIENGGKVAHTAHIERINQSLNVVLRIETRASIPTVLSHGPCHAKCRQQCYETEATDH